MNAPRHRHDSPATRSIVIVYGKQTTTLIERRNGTMGHTTDYPDRRKAERAADRFLGIERTDLERLSAKPIDGDDLPF